MEMPRDLWPNAEFTPPPHNCVLESRHFEYIKFPQHTHNNKHNQQDHLYYVSSKVIPTFFNLGRVGGLTYVRDDSWWDQMGSLFGGGEFHCCPNIQTIAEPLFDHYNIFKCTAGENSGFFEKSSHLFL